MTALSRWRILILLLAVGLLAAAIWQKRIRDSARDDLAAGRAALERGDPAEARRRFDLCLAHDPDNADANYLAARAARRCGDLGAAKDYLNKAELLGHPPGDIELERALVLAQRGYLAEGEAGLVEHIGIGGSVAVEIISHLFPFYMAQYRIAEAGWATAKWVEFEPDSAGAWACRADVLDRLHNKAEAVGAWRRVVALDPEDRRARFQLARLILETRRPPDEASAHLEWLLAREPDNTAASIQLAACRESQGRGAEAEALLDRVIASPAVDAKALHYRGRLEMHGGRPAAAAPFLRRAIGLDPSDAELLYTYFLCVQQIGTPEEAREAESHWRRCEADMKRVSELGRAIAESPKDPDLRFEIGGLFLRNGRTVEGVRWLDSALRNDPAHIPTHKLLAAHYERSGQPDMAGRHRLSANGTKSK